MHRAGPALRTLAVAVALAAPGFAARASAQAVDSAAAVAALAELNRACEIEAGRLWGRTLCGPIVLVHAPTRTAFASERDPDAAFAQRGAAFTGRLPSSILLANTAVRWGGELWAMVLLPLPADRTDRIRLLAHESFHRIQPVLGLSAPDASNAHLDARDGRVWLRMELRALAAALGAGGMAARPHVRDALAFRRHRHALYPGADTLEAALERQEGLAEYTGVRVAAIVTEQEPSVLDALAAFEARRSYVRSFAYATGPALGLLLDRLAPDWRRRAAVASLPSMLADAIGPPAPRDSAALVTSAQRYGHDDVAREEDARAAAVATRDAEHRQRFVDGATLVLRQKQLNTAFDPNALVPFAGGGTVYPTGTFQAEWGRLIVAEGGALLTPEFALTVAAPAEPPAPDARTIEGPGWTLELAEGWSLAPAARPGSFELLNQREH